MGPLNWGGREADMEIFIRLLRVVLENAYLVPSGLSPSLSSQPLLCVCVGGAGGGVGQREDKASGYRHSQNSLLPCELEEIE